MSTFRKQMGLYREFWRFPDNPRLKKRYFKLSKSLLILLKILQSLVEIFCNITSLPSKCKQLSNSHGTFFEKNEKISL